MLLNVVDRVGVIGLGEAGHELVHRRFRILQAGRHLQVLQGVAEHVVVDGVKSEMSQTRVEPALGEEAEQRLHGADSLRPR